MCVEAVRPPAHASGTEPEPGGWWTVLARAQRPPGGPEESESAGERLPPLLLSQDTPVASSARGRAHASQRAHLGSWGFAARGNDGVQPTRSQAAQRLPQHSRLPGGHRVACTAAHAVLGSTSTAPTVTR